MAVPPPPAPPAPPPQPALGKLGGGSGGGDARSALLQSIQKGTKLKKTVTVDKSGPALAGKLVGDTSSPGRTHTRPDGGGGGGSSRADGPKLAGIFEGMSSMPKLKPVGSRGANQVSPVSPARDQVDAEVSRNDRVNDNVALDLNTELTKHLTLKKQKQQQKNVTEANLKINRGPPPNPPQKLSTITPPDSDSSRGFQSHSPEAKRFQNVSSGVISADNNSAGPQSGAVANKSSLFNSMAQPPPPQVKPNHGKPNLAPKPPGQPPGNGSTKASVARHHSMKSPRSRRSLFLSFPPPSPLLELFQCVCVATKK